MVLKDLDQGQGSRENSEAVFKNKNRINRKIKKKNP